MTFDDAAAAYIRQHSAAWSSPKHAAQWPATLQAYASPILGKMDVSAIETAHVMEVLEPIWKEKPETASRLRGRIEAVLGWATVSGYRSGPNPAAWRDHLENLLPSPAKIRVIKHQTSLPYQDMPQFMAALRQRQGMAALCEEWTILNCVRSSDARNAKHADVDRQAKVWTIPAFSKTGVEFKVPLSDAALACFDRARAMATAIGGAVGRSEYAFCNDLTGARLSETAMLAVLDRMGYRGKATTHGMRATFRTWALEATAFPWELCEMSLGHTVGSKVERAYQRGDGFEKRVAIMQAWANHCARPDDGSKVLPMRRGQGGIERSLG